MPRNNNKMNNLILIENDIFDINTRLKAIDDGYFIVYNTVKNKYEVHNRKNGINTYAITVPFDELDYRTVILVNRTIKCNVDKLFAEIDSQYQ